jgi:hypothetical protein
MKDSTRRMFIARSLAGGCTALALPALVHAAPPHVEEADETATALGYKHDTRQVDKQRFPKHSDTQNCANCAFFQGGSADEWAGCAMFGRKHIAASGWCSAWARKPG